MLTFNQVLLEDVKTKKCKGVEIIPNKEFKEYRKSLEKEGRYVSVIKNTSLKEVDEDEIKEDDELLVIGENYYVLKDEKTWLSKGYICVGEDRFIRVENWLFLIIFLLGLCLLGILFSLRSCGNEISYNPLIPNKPIEIEDENKWDGQQQQNGDISQAMQETTTIPGYSKIYAREGQSLVQLYNPEENTTYFIYSITLPVESEVVAEFPIKDYESRDEAIKIAQSFVNDHQVVYENYYDVESNDYMVKDSDGNISGNLVEYSVVETETSFSVEKRTSEMIYFTKAIAPNNKVDWNVMDFFTSGTYNVQFRITPYDITTQAICYGAVNDVEITVQ